MKDIEEMKKAVLDRFGKIDILINNAGIAPMNKALNISMEEWDRVIETNLNSVFLMTRIVGEKMIQQKKGRSLISARYWGKWLPIQPCIIARLKRGSYR